MDVNCLTISIGNTRIQIGVFIDGKLESRSVVRLAQGQEWNCLLDQAFEQIGDYSDAPVLVASVNDVFAPQVIAAVQKQPNHSIIRVEQDLPVSIGRQLDPEAIVGVDRLLNAAAAFDVLKQACVVVDAGTAITVDYVDGVGTFHGGAIGPGAQMMLDSLHRGTAELPQLQMSKPDETIGHSTAQAMLGGVYHGARGMVRELVEQYADVAGIYPMVVATGGDAPLLFEDYELMDRIVDELTLLGLAATYQSQKQSEV